MKIAVVGCGAVGGYYGACLARAGQEVFFLLRSDHEAVRRNGLRVVSAGGDFHINPRCARLPEEIGPCDLVIIALKTTANHAFARLLPPVVGPGTALLTLQNGLGNEEQLAALFGSKRVLGGLCFVCLNRVAPGVIHHLAHGKITMGEHAGWPEPRTHEIAGVFRHAGIPVTVTSHLERTHWEKLVWNIPFNGLGVASALGLEAFQDPAVSGQVAGPCLTTDLLLADPRWNGVVRALMREVIAIARARGFDLPDEMVEEQILATDRMGAYQTSTAIDFETGRELELESLFLKPLAHAQNLRIPTSWLERLCQVLEKLGGRTPTS